MLSSFQFARWARRVTAALVAWFCFLHGYPTASQESQNPQSQFTFRLSTNLVLVNVVARDKQGNPVRNLQAQDFTVLEDGREQRITSFDSQNLDDVAEQAAHAPAEATAANNSAAPRNVLKAKDAQEVLNNKRVIVLFFDLSSMDADSLKRAVEAGKKYVQFKMTSADMIAVVSFASSLRLDLDFTADKNRLLATLGRFSPSEGRGTENGPTGDSDLGEENGDSYIPDQSDYNEFNTDRRLQALQSLCRVLSRFNEKKSLIYFSSGMTQTGVENTAAVRAAVNTAVRSNVAIYAMDTRALEAMPPGGSASLGSLRGNVMYTGLAVQQQSDQNFASQETLVTVAGDTGGKAFLDTNDFGQVFDQVQRDASVYYILGYRSSSSARDGSFRRIQLKINRPGVRLEFRKGYYAPKDFKHFDGHDKERQLTDELNAELSSTDISVYMSLAYFRLDESRFSVPISLVVPGSQIPFNHSGDQEKASVDVIGEVQDELKRPVGDVRQTVKLALPTEQQVQHKNVQYTTGFVLPAGKYHIKFVVRENEGGRVGSFETSFVVPDLRKAPLKISSVVLASQRQENNKKSQNPLVRNGSELIPNVAHVFSVDQHLYLQYEVYDPAKSKDKGAEKKHSIHLLTSIEFLDGQVKSFETPLVEVRELNAPERGAEVFQFDVPLDQLKPGLYTCQINVIDDEGGTFAFPRLPILVRAKPPA